MLEEKYDYKVVKITKFGDGDSFWCVPEKDMGFHLTGQALVHVRVLHVDTPERGEPNYKEASEFTKVWLLSHLLNLRIRSIEEDEFGRYLCEVYDSSTQELLSDAIKQAGLMKPGSKWNDI